MSICLKDAQQKWAHIINKVKLVIISCLRYWIGKQAKKQYKQKNKQTNKQKPTDRQTKKQNKIKTTCKTRFL